MAALNPQTTHNTSSAGDDGIHGPLPRSAHFPQANDVPATSNSGETGPFTNNNQQSNLAPALWQTGRNQPNNILDRVKMDPNGCTFRLVQGGAPALNLVLREQPLVNDIVRDYSNLQALPNHTFMEMLRSLGAKMVFQHTRGGRKQNKVTVIHTGDRTRWEPAANTKAKSAFETVRIHTAINRFETLGKTWYIITIIDENRTPLYACFTLDDPDQLTLDRSKGFVRSATQAVQMCNPGKGASEFLLGSFPQYQAMVLPGVDLRLIRSQQDGAASSASSTRASPSSSRTRRSSSIDHSPDASARAKRARQAHSSSMDLVSESHAESDSSIEARVSLGHQQSLSVTAGLGGGIPINFISSALARRDTLDLGDEEESLTDEAESQMRLDFEPQPLDIDNEVLCSLAFDEDDLLNDLETFFGA